ncbi:MAG: hypothetical protein RJP95_04585 [Pirellulales bacterium]
MPHPEEVSELRGKTLENPKRRARDSNPQPVNRHLNSNQVPHSHNAHLENVLRKLLLESAAHFTAPVLDDTEGTHLDHLVDSGITGNGKIEIQVSDGESLTDGREVISRVEGNVCDLPPDIVALLKAWSKVPIRIRRLILEVISGELPAASNPNCTTATPETEHVAVDHQSATKRT